jgi:hypothetical protein
MMGFGSHYKQWRRWRCIPVHPCTPPLSASDSVEQAPRHRGGKVRDGKGGVAAGLQVPLRVLGDGHQRRDTPSLHDSDLSVKKKKTKKKEGPL